MTPNFEIVLLPHALFGALTVLAASVLFVDAWLTGGQSPRIVRVAWVVAVLAWFTFVSGGFWYIYGYPSVKPVIKGGPWPWAHYLVMETKEHVFFLLLLLATILPVGLRDLQRTQPGGVRAAAMTLAGLIVLLGLLMEGMGAVVSLAARVALLK